jgi:hypothetical protein
MAGVNALSDRAIEQIRQLVREESGRLRGAQILPRPPLGQGPECFMAYTASGIDAATEGSGLTIAGSGLCDLYERNKTTNVLQGLFVTSSDKNQRTVYNASTTAIAAGFFPVWRDKAGTWWAQVTGSSSSITRVEVKFSTLNTATPPAVTTAIEISPSVGQETFGLKASLQTPWTGTSPVSVLSQAAYTDPQLEVDIAGEYCVHISFYGTFIWTGSTLPTSGEFITAWSYLFVQHRTPPAGAYTSYTGPIDSKIVCLEFNNSGKFYGERTFAMSLDEDEQIRVLWQLGLQPATAYTYKLNSPTVQMQMWKIN